MKRLFIILLATFAASMLLQVTDCVSKDAAKISGETSSISRTDTRRNDYRRFNVPCISSAGASEASTTRVNTGHFCYDRQRLPKPPYVISRECLLSSASSFILLNNRLYIIKNLRI